MNNSMSTNLVTDEIEQFLERYKLLKLRQGEIDSLNSPIYIKEIESMINNLSKTYKQV